MYRRREESHGGRTQRCDSSRHRQETPPWQPRLGNHTKKRQEFYKEHLCLRNAVRAASVEQEGTPNRRGHMPLEPIIMSRGSNSAGMQKLTWSQPPTPSGLQTHGSRGFGHQCPCAHVASPTDTLKSTSLWLTLLQPAKPTGPQAPRSLGFYHQESQFHKPWLTWRWPQRPPKPTSPWLT